MRSRLLETVMAGVVSLAAVAAVAPDAGASYPGRNGLIAFTFFDGINTPGENIYTVFRDNPRLTQLTDDGNSSAPSWSADGAKIVYNRGQQVRIMSATGAPIALVTTNGSHPAFSPTGGEVVFGRTTGLFRAAVTGGAPVRLTTSPGGCADNFAQWSATGTRILFERTCGAAMTVMTVNPATRSSRALTGLAKYRISGPVKFMPDGTHVTFTASCDNAGACQDLVSNVLVTDLAGGSLRAITHLRDATACDRYTGDCQGGYFETEPGPDGNDWVYTWTTPSGAAAPCLSGLVAKVIQCSFGGWYSDLSWQRT